MERLQKIIAARGLCSRRQAEKWIEEGRVRVNGNTAHLGDTADITEDVIEVDGKRLPSPTRRVGKMPPRWWRAAASGSTPWDGWIWTQKVCFCSPMTVNLPI